MKSVLVPCETHDLLDSTLATACLFGELFDSHIEGFPLRSVVPVIAADTMAVPILYETLNDPASSAEVGRRYNDFMRGAYAPRSYSWVDDSAIGDPALGSAARVFDITVVARPGNEARSPRMTTLESVLFDSGRPILIAPPTAPVQLGGTVAIAWNRSTETARTLALSMPLLQRAGRIAVLALQNVSGSGPSGEQAAAYLRRNDVNCEVINVEGKPRANGEAILAEVSRIGADLLIKGAYTQSRLRQLIFGGATQHIIATTKIPVFMAH